MVCLVLVAGCGGDGGSTGGEASSDESGGEETDSGEETDAPDADGADADGADGGQDAVADGSDVDDAEPATFGDVLVVFNQSCSFSSCHGSAPKASTNGNLELTEDVAWASLVNAPADNAAALAEGTLLVVPGDPDASYLVFKLEMPWADAGGAHGNPMPDVSGARLPPESIALIRSWITAGALDN